MRLTSNDRVRALRDCDSHSFVTLSRAAGMDGARDYIGADLRGITFAGDDLDGFVFHGADLRGANRLARQT